MPLRKDLATPIGGWTSTLQTHPLSGIAVRDWPCDRCDADARQPCRTLRSGAPRRTAHLARWSTAAVFTLAARWLPRLPVWDRLSLATRASRARRAVLRRRRGTT
ncbi:hypothetical protein BJF90_01775 [Pseudonocardia sp. CNS-004]|nr:hypothetical protein BJF90_01775 [Pseudonocardia sp. CNS-004]